MEFESDEKGLTRGVGNGDAMRSETVSEGERIGKGGEVMRK